MPKIIQYPERLPADLTGDEYTVVSDQSEGKTYRINIVDSILEYGGGGGSSTLNGLTDTDISGVGAGNDGYALTYDHTSAKWIATQVAATVDLQTIITAELAENPTKVYWVYGGEDANNPGLPAPPVQADIDLLISYGVPEDNIRWLFETPIFTIGGFDSQSTVDNIVLLRKDGVFIIGDVDSQSTQDAIVMTRTYGGVMTIADATSQSTQTPIVMTSPFIFDIFDQTSQSTQDAIVMTRTYGGVMTIADVDSQSTQDGIILVKTGGNLAILDQNSQSTQDAIVLTQTGWGTFTIDDVDSQSTQDTIVMTIQGPAPPTGLNATSITTTTFDLSWDHAIPAAFDFTDVTNATASSVVESNTHQFSTITVDTDVESLTGGLEYTDDNGTTWYGSADLPRTISPNDILKVRLTASSQPGGTVSGTITIGGVSDTYQVTTGPETVAATASSSLGAFSTTITGLSWRDNVVQATTSNWAPALGHAYAYGRDTGGYNDFGLVRYIASFAIPSGIATPSSVEIRMTPSTAYGGNLTVWRSSLTSMPANGSFTTDYSYLNHDTEEGGTTTIGDTNEKSFTIPASWVTEQAGSVLYVTFRADVYDEAGSLTFLGDDAFAGGIFGAPTLHLTY